jgi:predicted RNase H-like HicB family nuclease
MVLKVIIEKVESGYYLAEVPALPGRLSQGRTLDDVEKNIKEAIEGWLEVMNDIIKKESVQEVLEIVV